ncbi:hypothetical protein PV772_21545, partial [Pseudarthrobacter sp. CC12]|uniref:hypothetical protein n=1 Tax=Pseudarthrobacter sp. CC12 TaxID=3029193 RepID=UPI003265B30A
KQQTHPAPPKPNIQDRSGATFQTYPIPRPEANPSFRTHIEEKTAPTDCQRPKEQPESGFDLGVLATR